MATFQLAAKKRRSRHNRKSQTEESTEPAYWLQIGPRPIRRNLRTMLVLSNPRVVIHADYSIYVLGMMLL
ncbi:MAG: hypothetical protein KDA84_05615, partial [Planctomycetaceae bacterium]|nr:hypothetical protein [Planctomycetaceae bacterium]